MENCIYLIGGYQLETDETSRLIYQLDLRNEKWSIFSEIPRGSTVSCGAAINSDYLYVTGGHDGVTCKFSLSCNRLNLQTLEWIHTDDVAGYPVFFNGSAVACAGTMFYSTDCIQRVGQISDPDHRESDRSKMLSVPPFPEDFLRPVRIALPGGVQVPIASLTSQSVMATGGFDADNGHARTESFVVGPLLSWATKWTSAAPMAVPRGSHGLVRSPGTDHIFAIGGTWLFGGRHSYRCCEVYDIGSNRWSFIRPMQMPRRDFALSAVAGQIFVFGGFDGVKGIFFDSEVYDERSGKWRKGPDVPDCLWNYSVVSRST